MVSIATVIAVCVTLFISLILPIVVLIVYAIKNKGKGIWTAWLLGAAGFFVMQIIIRLPILSILSTNAGFTFFATNHFVLYSFILAFTAGLSEVIGRYVVAKILSKNLTFERGIAAGLGHGGIEAMLVIGMTYVNNIIYILMINLKQFDAIIDQTAALGVDTSGLVMIKEQLINANSSIFYLAGYERILTMIAHVALSLLVCYFVMKKKDILGIGICVVLHCCMDFVAPLVNGMSTEYLGNIISTTTAYIIVYVFLTLVAVLAVILIKHIYKNWKKAVTLSETIVA